MPAPESGRAGGARKLLLDEMELEREREPLPPPPVLQLAPVAVEAAAPASRKNVKQRMAELEEIAWRNLRAAEEARQVVFAEYARLEREATARSDAENEAAGLKRELEKLRENDERRAAQARFAVTREVRAEVAEEIQKAQAEHNKVVEELNRLRGTLDDHDSLLTEYSERLREEQLAVASMRSDLEKAEDARKRAERELEAIREQAHTRASDEVDRLKAAEIELKETRIARDRLQTEINALKADDAVAAVRAELEEQLQKQAAEVARLEASLGEQTTRAEAAEQAVTTAEEARAAAEQAAATAEHAAAEAQQTAAEAATAHEQLSTDSLEAEQRARDAEKLLGRLRKEASSSTQARQEAETTVAQAERELSERAARIEEQGRHIDGLESQLKATRAALEELQAWARTAEAHIESLHAANGKQSAAAPAAAQPKSAPAKVAAPAEPVAPAKPATEKPAAPAEAAPAAADAGAVPADIAEPEEPTPEPAKKKRPSDGPPVEGIRRSAMAELTALAATGDDSKSRRGR